MYKLVKNYYEGEPCIVNRLSDNAFIPINPDNKDYQAYLAWVAEGNTPEEAK